MSKAPPFPARPDEGAGIASTDFRIGVPLTHRSGPWETKLAYYHLCSHAGDQFMLDFPEVGRVPYLRDAIDLGFAYCPTPNLRLYSEFGWAFRPPAAPSRSIYSSAAS